MIKGRETFKIFESNIRLKMVAGLSKSNLTYIATHTKKLVSAGFIDVKKEFVNNKPKTTYNLTEYGQKEFKEYIKFLKKIIEETEK